MNAAANRRLLRLLELPTAPFREQEVARFALEQCARSSIPCCLDPLGNVVVGASDRKDYRRLLRMRSSEPVRLFVAHMDHPGFHGVRWLDRRTLAARWYGGSPLKHLRGAAVWLSAGAGYAGKATIARATVPRGGYAMTELAVRIADPALREHSAKALFGGFGFRAPVWATRSRVYTKAADDLVGVFAILETARAAFSRRSSGKRPPFLGLLTRGEEVGFVGAVGHLELGWLSDTSRRVIGVSLECSRTLPGALVGAGPVVRLGDRRTVFEPGATAVLGHVAARVLGARHQRRIMDGGSCEATAATVWGLPAIGISAALGNYHNQGYEGGPDCRAPLGPAPEYVDLNDVDGMLRLCRGLIRDGLPWGDPWTATRRRLRKNFRGYRSQLRRHPIEK